MSHCQIFYPFDNADGYISVICHRERFLNDLLSVGWQKTAAEAIAVRDQLVKDKSDLMDLADKAVMDVLSESVPLPHDAADQAPAAKKRDKLSLKK